MYEYFIAYKWEKGGGISGVGNCAIEVNRKIAGIKEIRETEAYICSDGGFIRVVISNFTLLSTKRKRKRQRGHLYE